MVSSRYVCMRLPEVLRKLPIGQRWMRKLTTSLPSVRDARLPAEDYVQSVHGAAAG